MTARQRECLDCGMLHTMQVPEITERELRYFCVKCDSELLMQSDGSQLTRDVAHQQETVAEAERKTLAALNEAWRGYAGSIRLIVGGGRIRDALLGQLHYLKEQRVILDYSLPQGNPGAIVIRLR